MDRMKQDPATAQAASRHKQRIMLEVAELMKPEHYGQRSASSIQLQKQRIQAQIKQLSKPQPCGFFKCSRPSSETRARLSALRQELEIVNAMAIPPDTNGFYQAAYGALNNKQLDDRSLYQIVTHGPQPETEAEANVLRVLKYLLQQKPRPAVAAAAVADSDGESSYEADTDSDSETSLLTQRTQTMTRPHDAAASATLRQRHVPSAVVPRPAVDTSAPKAPFLPAYHDFGIGRFASPPAIRPRLQVAAARPAKFFQELLERMEPRLDDYNVLASAEVLLDLNEILQNAAEPSATNREELRAYSTLRDAVQEKQEFLQAQPAEVLVEVMQPVLDSSTTKAQYNRVLKLLSMFLRGRKADRYTSQLQEMQRQAEEMVGILQGGRRRRPRSKRPAVRSRSGKRASKRTKRAKSKSKK